MEQPSFMITADRFGQVLLTWSNPPGAGAEFYPDQLKSLAEQFLELVEAVPAISEILR